MRGDAEGVPQNPRKFLGRVVWVMNQVFQALSSAFFLGGGSGGKVDPGLIGQPVC